MKKEILDIIHPVKKETTKFKPGDTVRVTVKISEGGTERLQPYEGIVTKKKGSELDETFTVRRVSFGIGIERIFPVHSPSIAKIELVKEGSVRRAKLYYLRNLTGKAAKVKDAEKQQVEKQPKEASPAQ